MFWPCLLLKFFRIMLTPVRTLTMQFYLLQQERRVANLTHLQKEVENRLKSMEEKVEVVLLQYMESPENA